MDKESEICNLTIIVLQRINFVNVNKYIKFKTKLI